jgi:flagellin
MAFRIATNTASINTQRYLGISNAGQSKALERLSSGYKINKASDDAAGIATATKLYVKSQSMSKAIDNGNQASAMLQTAEGGIDQISNILTRLKELATQAASSNTTDIAALDSERTKLEAEIDNIANNTKYGSTALLNATGGATRAVANSGTAIDGPSDGISSIDVSGSTNAAAAHATFTIDVTNNIATLTVGGTSQSVSYGAEPTGLNTTTLDFTSLGVKVNINSAMATSISANNAFSITVGAGGSFTFQVGDSNVGENKLTAAIADFRTTALGFDGGVTKKMDTQANAQAYLGYVDTAVGTLTTERGKLGSTMNQVSYHVANLETMNENTKSAVSTIKDADFAAEMADFTKFQILSQSGIAMLAQANQLPQLVLSLLK